LFTFLSMSVSTFSLKNLSPFPVSENIKLSLNFQFLKIPISTIQDG
jgi:hypothetical protein